MKKGKTKTDLELNLWGSKIVLPKGTDVIYIGSANGGWAVESARLLSDLTGNKHDPYYRYAWVKEEDVIHG